jgi:hypothetical protein
LFRNLQFGDKEKGVTGWEDEITVGELGWIFKVVS